MKVYEDFIRLTGYHATKYEYAVNISEPQDFVPSLSDTEWLGAGVYFWDELFNARWWAKVKYKNRSSAIIKIRLECDDEFFLDLDSTEEFYEYKKFISRITDYIENMSKELKDTYLNLDFDDVKAVRCFYLNAYKEVVDIALVRRTFEVEGYGQPEDGMKPTRTQLCVSDGYQDSVIKDVEVYYE